MSHQLHSKPETRVEQSDMEAITTPHLQKQFATNQGVRFYVDRESRLLEQALMNSMNGKFTELDNSLQELGRSLQSATAQITDLTARLAVLEIRWYERLMQDFEWDWLHIREWLFKKFGWGSNPFTESVAEGTHFCKCGHSVQQHQMHDPGYCMICPDCKYEEAVKTELRESMEGVFSDDVDPAQRA